MPVSAKVKVRRRSRRIALQALYEIDCANHDPQGVMEQRLAGQSLPPNAIRFIDALVQGVLAHRTQLDLLIQANAPEWPIEQMAIVDRNILRLAVYELASSIGTPPKVAINEAVELAKTFGSDSSPRFINGVLGTLMRDKGSALKKALAAPAGLTSQ
jgi:N utilization substance protein B